MMGTVGALILPAFTYSRTKRTSPLQTPCIPQSLRDLLRFACQMQSALADIFLLHLVTSSRSVFALLEHYGVISYKVKNRGYQETDSPYLTLGHNVPCIFFTFYRLPLSSFPALLKASCMLSAVLPEL